MQGSPPRMRGKRCQTLTVTATRRITPADAGKTAAVKLKACIQQDHPRGCGENAISSFSMPVSTGSPPRMRGKPEASERSIAALGITPADAGKTAVRLRLGCFG